MGPTTPGLVRALFARDSDRSHRGAGRYSPLSSTDALTQPLFEVAPLGQ